MKDGVTAVQKMQDAETVKTTEIALENLFKTWFREFLSSINTPELKKFT